MTVFEELRDRTSGWNMADMKEASQRDIASFVLLRPESTKELKASRSNRVMVSFVLQWGGVEG